MGIFSGLGAYGLGKLEKATVYENENNTGNSKKSMGAEGKQKVTEADLLFDKSHTCPICDKEFKAKTIRTGKIKLISADTDLRPVYELVDALKYDAFTCPQCGYSALSRFFNFMTSRQAKLIREQISINFTGISAGEDIYTYDDAIIRHKLALINTIVKQGKASEKAYTCLKLAWLYRGKAETLPKEEKDSKSVLEGLKNEEAELIVNAYEGFSAAFSKEQFPLCGMDENTATYLVADLARRSGKYADASRLVSRVITSREANERTKNRARELKDLIKEDEAAVKSKNT